MAERWLAEEVLEALALKGIEILATSTKTKVDDELYALLVEKLDE
jgi:hypothetical protein